MAKAIKVEGISKQYRLGQVGTGSFSHDLNRFWHKIRGKEDPYLKIGEENDREKLGDSEYVWSLRNINFEIEKGEAVGIIGKNGAGKSTLLKILSRVTAPTMGSFKARGRIASLLEVGTGFHPELTGRENIFLNGAILGMRKKEIQKKFDEIVDFAGVERYIDTPVKRYSSGMYVRLAFAVAAHLESEILIVDEVLAVGDSEFQRKCLGKMGEVSKGEGRTVLFVSHNMTSLQALCNNCILLKNGNIFYEGKSNDVISKYYGMMSNTKHVLIKDRVDREGNGVALITELSLNGEQYETNILSTSDLNFVLKYTSNLERFYGKILIGVYDQSERRLFYLDSGVVEGLPTFFPGNGEINISIENSFALYPGKYCVNIVLLVNNEFADYVQEAFYFNIVDGDFLGTGKLPTAEYLVLPRQTWQLKTLNHT